MKINDKHLTLVSNLASLPVWESNVRKTIAIEHDVEIRSVLGSIPRDEILALADELPKWAVSFCGNSWLRRDLPIRLFDITERLSNRLSDRETVALYLIIMDLREDEDVSWCVPHDQYAACLSGEMPEHR